MLAINQMFNSFYGNGQFAGVVTIVRMTDKSVFVTCEYNGTLSSERREAITSANKYILSGLWKPFNNPPTFI